MVFQTEYQLVNAILYGILLLFSGESAGGSITIARRVTVLIGYRGRGRTQAL